MAQVQVQVQVHVAFQATFQAVTVLSLFFSLLNLLPVLVQAVLFLFFFSLFLSPVLAAHPLPKCIGDLMLAGHPQIKWIHPCIVL
jgi:hypothetical protein